MTGEDHARRAQGSCCEDLKAQQKPSAKSTKSVASPYFASARPFAFALA